MKGRTGKKPGQLRKECLIFALAFCLAVGMAAPAAASQRKGQTAIRVLLVGNSFTLRNNLGEMLQKIARSCGVRLTVRTLAKEGISLAQYADEESTLGKRLRRKLQSGNWDYVILQDKRSRPLTDAAGMEKDMVKLSSLIREAGAEPMLYMTWAPQEWQTDYEIYSGLVSDREEYQEILTAAYEDIAKEAGTQLIPAGLAVLQAEETFPNRVFERKDGFHPNKKGSYVVACTIYSALFSQSPYGSSTYTAGIAKETAMQLQCIAWENVSRYSRKNNKWKQR